MSSIIPSLGLSTTKVSGTVAAAIIAASIGIVAMGVLTYMRHMGPLEEWLVPYMPTAQYGGIFLYSNVIWGILWLGLFLGLRNKQNLGTLKKWLIFFLISLGIGTGLAEASLNWSQLSTLMQLGSNKEPIVTAMNNAGGQTNNEVTIKILKGSSVQGNPSFEPITAKIRKDDVITWINDDTAPHTVTSGIGTNDPKSGSLFDSGSLGQGQKFSLPAKDLGEAGDYSYFCVVHPFMKGRVTIQ
jgi:plastocyanin